MLKVKSAYGQGILSILCVHNWNYKYTIKPRQQRERQFLENSWGELGHEVEGSEVEVRVGLIL